MSILIVDDRKSVRSLVEFHLQHDGHEHILLADSAPAAFSLLDIDIPEKRGNGVNLILMDIVMPEVDGIEACKTIKAADHLKDIPIIVITSNVSDENLSAAFAAGAMDFIPKPLQKTELVARVRSALHLKQEIDARQQREEELIEMTAVLETTNKKLQLSNDLLQRISSTDSLCDVANRRYFEDIFAREFNRAKRNNHPLSLLLADIDHFKQYNDLYGHQMGDACLRDVAQALKDALRRPCDLLARYGGEEFVAILPETDQAGAMEIAELMQKNIRQMNIAHEASEQSEIVTVSIGAATCQDQSFISPAEIIGAADQALYRAKSSGRNCCCHFDEQG